LDTTAFVILATASFVGAVLQAAFGFGYAILAAPIFLSVMNSHAAIQVLVVLHVVLSAIVVPGIWPDAPRRLTALLMAGSLAGFPIGMAIFLSLDIKTLRLAVGIVTILFTLVLLKRTLGPANVSPPREAEIDFRPASALSIGFLSGLLTAVLVMPGPTAMLYLRALGFTKDQSRAAALTFFAFCYVMVTLMSAFWGSVSRESWVLAATLLPAVIVGAIAGNLVAGRLSETRYRNAVLTLLLLSGAYAVWSAL
jgi:uncharacterized membrane protein YfcA